MPLTSSTISGRRSFGGANIEIEKLNDPSSHQAPQTTTGIDDKDGKKSSSNKKKKQNKNEPISTRRTDQRTKRSETSERERGDIQVGGEKKKRRISEEGGGGDVHMGSAWEGGEDEVSFSTGGGFKKPGGFEGAKTGSSTKGKGKGKGASNTLMDPDSHKWGKRGDVREWDREKGKVEEYELGDEEADQKFLDGLEEEDSAEDSGSESDSESEDDEAEEIKKMLMSAKALDRKQAASKKDSKEKKEMIERELRRSEEQRIGDSNGGSSSRRKGPAQGTVKSKGKGRK